ncbi:MAG TPA: enoyl-CoA hydratase/isomerase family protein [Pseudonocardiaceae bacterium]|jgi:enoyl-CoA hydratase/carnithine racemase|nr:enoyl-CoA hydratase/isomerase family protein [Pseudonocardiaceae bacterium]
MMQQGVHVSSVDSVDGVGLIEIRRPHRRNAVDLASARAISAGLRQLAGDPGCRVILLCGQGGDLSAGADLKAVDEQPTPAGQPSARTTMLADLAASLLPVVAVVDGWAIGTGLGLAAAATFTVAGEGSRFQLPEVSQGFYPYQVVPHLVRRVAPEVVLRWALSGVTVGAAEAAAAGLVTTVCADGQAESTARQLARELATGPRHVVETGMRWWQDVTGAGGRTVAAGRIG